MNIRYKSTETERQNEQMAHNMVRLANYHTRRFAHQRGDLSATTVNCLPLKKERNK